MVSVWEDNSLLPSFESLEGDTKTDVLIVGGGITGVLCAYFLEQAGVDYILVERDRICSGITKNTTAKITSQHGLIYDKMIRKIGREGAKKYLEVNELALEKYSQLCSNIDCDFERKDAYVYSLSNEKKIRKEVAAVNKLGFNAEFTNDINLPFQVQGAIKFPNQAQFNPLKFVSEIAKNLNIYENTFVEKSSGNSVITDKGKIQADNIIYTTHFPIVNNHGLYFMKMYQHRSYAIALKNAQNINDMYLEEIKDGLSFRNYKDMLIIGGGDHRTGKKGGNWEELRQIASAYYPNSEEVYYWATQDCMTLDDRPYIGKYSRNTHNMYVATGFNKWGMSSAMVSAMILSNMVMGENNQYQHIFSPSRNMIQPQLFCNLFETVTNFVYPSTKRCPHLGCTLKWNNIEHTWDCPCHGSRFMKNGKLIDNPANGNIK